MKKGPMNYLKSKSSAELFTLVFNTEKEKEKKQSAQQKQRKNKL